MRKDHRRNAEGKYYRQMPVDFAIIENLPAEGSVLGYHVLAATVTMLAEKLNKGVPVEGQVTSTDLAARLVSMRSAGYVTPVNVMGAKQRNGWQRTRQGELFYEQETGRSLTPNSSLQVVNGGEGA